MWSNNCLDIAKLVVTNMWIISGIGIWILWIFFETYFTNFPHILHLVDLLGHVDLQDQINVLNFLFLTKVF